MGGYKTSYLDRLKNFEFTFWHGAGLFFVFLMAILLREHMAAVIIIGVLYVIDIVFDIFLRYTLRPIYRAVPLGIELVTMNTIIAGVALGPTAGLVCGLLFGLTYYGIVFNFNSMYQLINIPAYALIGYLAGSLAIGNIVVLGLLLSLLYCVLTCTLIVIFMGGHPGKAAIFFVTNILVNYWLFTHISPLVLKVIA